MAQNEGKYIYATVYDKECVLYDFKQDNLTTKKHDERLNTKVDVVEDIGITRQHYVLMEDIAQETVKTFDDLGSDETFK